MMRNGVDVSLIDYGYVSNALEHFLNMPVQLV